MIYEILDATNIAEINFDENFFQYCEVKDLTDGISAMVASTFVSCTFTKVDWYYTHIMFSNFIDCEFQNCTFSGITLVDSRFVESRLMNCTFRQNNMGGHCGVSRCVAYASTLSNCSNLPAELSESNGWIVL